MKTLFALLTCASLLLLFQPGIAFPADKGKEFDAIGKMNTAELIPRAKALLEKKYRNEDWEKYHFPKYVFQNEGATMAYKIAVKEPDLLSKFLCYCNCKKLFGHENLAYCLLKKGKLSAGFEPHGVVCNTCYDEAMMVFLWNDLGVDLPRMQEATKRIYERE